MERLVEKIIEVPVEHLVEKVVEVTKEYITEVPVVKVVEKVVYVPVEKIVEVPNGLWLIRCPPTPCGLKVGVIFLADSTGAAGGQIHPQNLGPSAEDAAVVLRFLQGKGSSNLSKNRLKEINPEKKI